MDKQRTRQGTLFAVAAYFIYCQPQMRSFCRNSKHLRLLAVTAEDGYSQFLRLK
ncbi:MAG: hypothetical protein ACH344_05725 [Yersinia sp. (in: enterobacteria)]